jgi:peptide/nickel transport system permease protein
VYVIVGQYLFAFRLGWFPVQGWTNSTLTNLAVYAPLPVMLAVLVSLAPNTRLYRSFFLDEIGHDYVRTARAKGVPKNVAIRRHALRMSLIPTAMGVVWSLTSVITGSVFVETIFAIDGAGKYFIDALTQNDINGSVAIASLGGCATCAGLLLADIVVALLDPRIRIG